MDTSLVDVDLHPVYVRLDIKGKVTQLKFDEEILVDKSKVQRSQTTGALLLTMPKASITEVEARNMRIQKMKEEKEQEDKLKALEKAQKEGIEKQKELAKEVREAKRKEEEEKTSIHDPEFVIRESKKGQEAKRMFVPDFDESEVPPLE
jgi:protein TilB